MLQRCHQFATLGILQPFQRALLVTGMIVAVAPTKRALVPDAQLCIGNLVRHLRDTSRSLLRQRHNRAVESHDKTISAISTFIRHWSNHVALLVSILYQICQHSLAQGPALEALLRYMADHDSPIPSPLRYIADALASDVDTQSDMTQRLGVLTGTTISKHLNIQISEEPLSLTLCEYKLDLDNDRPSLMPCHEPTPPPTSTFPS